MSWFNIGNLSDISDKYQTNFGHKSEEIWLGKRHTKAILYVNEKEKITKNEHRGLNKVLNKTAYFELAGIVEKGVIYY